MILTIASQKGGVGKTTTSVNVAHAWAIAGKRVALLDLDPQGNATTHLGVDSDGWETADALSRSTALELIEVRDQLFLAPGGERVASLQMAWQSEAVPAWCLAGALEAHPIDADVIIIDTPPTLSSLSTAAITASDVLVIPTTADPLALKGITAITRALSPLRRLNPELEINAILPTKYDARRALEGEALEALAGAFGEDRIAPHVRVNVSLAEAAGLGKSIFEYAPTSNGARDYQALADWLLEKMEQR